MQQLGHTSQDTALFYTQLGETTIKDSLEKIGTTNNRSSII